MAQETSSVKYLDDYLRNAALSIARQGTPIFPCSHASKNPLTEHGFQDASNDPDKVVAWWTKYPHALIGMPTGRITDVVVIDTDNARGEEELRLLCEQADQKWPATRVVRTSRGRHFYFKYPGKIEIGCSDRNLPDDVDVRGNGGYVIIPPSPHPNGGRYELVENLPIAELPLWLYKAIKGQESGEAIEIREATPLWAFKQYHRVVAELRRAREGERNNLLNKAAWWAARVSGHPLLAPEITSKEIIQIARSLGLRDGEIMATCRSGEEAGRKKKIKILPIHECTGFGNADRFVVRHGNVIRYVPAFGEKTGWHFWDGTRWNPDGKRRVRKLAQETVRAIHQEAASTEDPEIRKALGRWAIKSENARQVDDMLENVQPHVAVEPHELDADMELLNLENGTLDLRTGEVREQNQSDLITRKLPVSFEARASCPAFENHLRLVLPDEEVRAYFQEMIAYHLSGSTGEQCIHVLWGEGENGKSVTVDLFRNLAGDYGWVAPRTLFASGYQDIAAHQIADLYGRRFVTCSEFKSGDVLRVEVMKALTGGESTELNGCRKYGHSFKFRPQAKFLLDSNYLLTVDSPDFGTWRRIRLINFNQRISDKVVKDPHFDRRLWAERSGILNWIIVGLRRWNQRGRELKVPDAIVKASQGYEKESDLLEQFISQVCDRQPEHCVSLREFSAHYQIWCKEHKAGGKDRIGERAMETRLEKKGVRVEYDVKLRTKMVRGLRVVTLYAGFEP